MTGATVTTPTTATFNPLPWQVTAWRDKSPVMLLTGSAGGGKSRLAAEKVHGYCLKYPGTAALMMRKARQWCSKSIIPFYLETVIGADSRVRLNRGTGVFHYYNGSTAYIGGMHGAEQREAVRSIGGAGGLDIAWLEEANAFSRDDIGEVFARIRHTAAPWQQVIATTNPDAPTHWIYADLMQGGSASVHLSRASDNPYNSDGYAANLERLTGVLYDRLVLGLWKAAAGAVYAYDPTVHLLDSFEVPPDWARYRTIDFGYTNPFTCQWWAADGDGRLFLYRELYQTRQLVEDMARQIVALSEGERILFTVADHDAEDRATLERYGVPTIAAKKTISPGIQTVAQRLVIQGDGRPRLFIMRGALIEIDVALVEARRPTCLQEELPAYVWPQGVDGKPNREAPVKSNDHGCDGMRYLVMELDGGGAPAAGLPPRKLDTAGMQAGRKQRGRRWQKSNRLYGES